MSDRIFKLTDFLEYLRMLEAQRADYALIGGHAVALWTVRYVPDADCAAMGIDSPVAESDSAAAGRAKGPKTSQSRATPWVTPPQTCEP